MTDARLSVLVVAPAADGEDVSEAWNAFQWVRRLSERHDVTVIATYKTGHTPLSRQLPSVRIIEWKEPPLVWRFERLNSLLQPGYVPFYFRARRWVRRALHTGERFDIALQVIPVGMRYPSPAAGLGIPFVLGPVGGALQSPASFRAQEGATPWYQRLRALDRLRLRRDPLLRRTYESADCVLGIAPYVEESLEGLSIRRFETMSEVALDEVNPRVARDRRPGPVRLLHVGRTVRTKGLRDLIRALSQLRDLDVILDVLGEGNDRPACEELVTELGLGERVTFHGNVPRATVDEFYAASDIFAFPSYREPGGGVILEAMSFGLPLILCDNGGPASFVDSECAMLLPARSPEQLAADCARAIRTLVEDRELRFRMGESARRQAGERHLWRHRVAQMETLWDHIIDPIGTEAGTAMRRSESSRETR